MSTTLGPKITAPVWSGYVVTQGTLSARAVVDPGYVAPSPGWVTRLGVYARKSNNAPKVTLAIYSLDAAGNPSRLLGKTDKQTLTNVGGNFEAALQSAAPMDAGEGFALAVIVDGGAAEYAVLNPTTVWQRQMGSGVPTDPFGATNVATDFGIGLYAEFVADSAPAASLTSPASGATLNTTTPTFVVAFSDVDSASPTLDKLAQYGIEVRLPSNPSTLWGGVSATFAASPAEVSAGVATRVYAGPALTAGSAYEWRSRVADSLGVWSNWTAWRGFTLNAVGFVAVSGSSPTGKQDGDTTLLDWGGVWTHPSGQGMTAAKVRVLDDEGVVLKTGPSVAVSAANGASFSVPHASAGIGAISPGNYAYEIQGLASGGLWSAWSDPRAFSVNSPPSTPSNLQPPSGTSSTSYPLLEWNIADPDPDDVFGVDDNSEIELTRPNASVVSWTTLNYDAARAVGTYQLGATECPITGTYKWRVRGNDVSAGARGVGAWSVQQTFDYVAGPVVAITSPTEGQVVTTSAPTVTWSTTGQVRSLLRLYEADAKAALKSSGEVVGTLGVYQLPAGWLRNLGSYDLDVTVWNGSNQQGTSLRRRFSVLYTAPSTPAALNTTLVANRRDYEPCSVLLTWGDSDLPPGEFAGWLVWRRLASEDPSAAELLTTIPSAAQTRWLDHNAPGNEPLVYGLSQLRNAGTGAVLESGMVETEAEVPLHVPTLVSMVDGTNRRAALMWLDKGLKGSFKRPQALFQTWGSRGKNQVVSNPIVYGSEPITLTVTLKTDRDINGEVRGTRQEHVDDMEDLVTSGDPLCLRLEHKRKFYEISSYDWARGDRVGETVISLVLDEIDYREGQTTVGLT